MDVKDILRSYIREEFEIEDDPDFTDDVHLFDIGFLDSLGATQVILFIEEEFKIEITQKDLILYPMNTIDEIALVIEEKLN
ncbi:MAG: acyl carrier protein [Planococcus donghaensis]